MNRRSTSSTFVSSLDSPASAGVFFVWLLAGCAAVVNDPPDPRNQLAIELVELSGLDNEQIEVNPAAVVAIRSPRQKNRIMAPAANCALLTTDGRFISVLESCDEVRRRLGGAK